MFENVLMLASRYSMNFINGLGVTLFLAFVSVALGCVIGAVVAIMRLSRFGLLKAVAAVYTEVIRDTPLLLQLYFFYFLLPDLLPALRLTDFTSIAVALRAEKLIFLTQDRLIKDHEGNTITELAREEADRLLAESTLDEDTLAFLAHASRAVKRGVARAHLLPYTLDGSVLLEIFTHDGVGTMVVEDALDDLRPAMVDDVGAIVQLIEPLEADGTLVPRGRSTIERDVEKFTVLEHDGVIYGCVAIMPYLEDGMAEMACLIVHSEWQSAGEGEMLLRHAEMRARAMGARRLFVLTTRTSHWFIKRGFVQGSISDLPKERQLTYNRSRNSLIFIKRL